MLSMAHLIQVKKKEQKKLHNVVETIKSSLGDFLYMKKFSKAPIINLGCQKVPQLEITWSDILVSFAQNWT